MGYFLEYIFVFYLPATQENGNTTEHYFHYCLSDKRGAIMGGNELEQSGLNKLEKLEDFF